MSSEQQPAAGHPDDKALPVVDPTQMTVAGSAAEPCAPKPGLEGCEETELIEALRQVIDPELMINIVDLGLIYEIDREEGVVTVDMTLTSPACPAGPQLMQQSKMALERIEGVTEAKIKLVMSPPWTPERMTDDARDQLGIF